MARKKTAKPAETPVPKKRFRLVTNRRRRRARANPSPSSAPRANPPIGSDFVNVLLPGFAAYTATRFIQRIVYTMVQRRWPKLGKHAHAAAGAIAFGGVWFFAHKVKSLARFHDGVVMGSGVAAFQGVAQCYLPKYGWLTSDCKAEDVARKNGNGAAALPPGTTVATPEAEGMDEYSYLEAELDAIDGGRRAAPARTIAPRKATRHPVAAAMKVAGTNAGMASDMDDDLLSELGDDEDVDDLYSGAFEN